MNLDNSLGTLLIIALSGIYVLYALTTGWKYIPNRWAGVVIRFGRIRGYTNHQGQFVGDVLGEGPVKIWVPFERLIKVPLFDLPIRIPLDDLPTAAPNPQNVRVKFYAVLRFANPVATVLSVPDRDPIQEFVGFLRAAALQGVQSMTIEQLSQSGAAITLANCTKALLLGNPTLQRWGLDVPDLQVEDINLSATYLSAVEKLINAQAEGDAARIAAQAEADAIGIQRAAQGDEMFTQLETLQTLERAMKSLQPGVTIAGDILSGLLFRNGKKENHQ